MPSRGSASTTIHLSPLRNDRSSSTDTPGVSALAVIYVPVADGPVLSGLITRSLAAIPLLLYGLYLFIQWQDVSDSQQEASGEGSVLRSWR